MGFAHPFSLCLPRPLSLSLPLSVIQLSPQRRLDLLASGSGRQARYVSALPTKLNVRARHFHPESSRNKLTIRCPVNVQ